MRCSASRITTTSPAILWSGSAGKGSSSKTYWPSPRRERWQASTGRPPAQRSTCCWNCRACTALPGIEIKRGPSATPRKGFRNARDDLKPTRSFIVHAGEERYPVAKDIEAIGLKEMAELVAQSPPTKPD